MGSPDSPPADRYLYYSLVRERLLQFGTEFFPPPPPFNPSPPSAPTQPRDPSKISPQAPPTPAAAAAAPRRDEALSDPVAMEIDRDSMEIEVGEVRFEAPGEDQAGKGSSLIRPEKQRKVGGENAGAAGENPGKVGGRDPAEGGTEVGEPQRSVEDSSQEAESSKRRKKKKEAAARKKPEHQKQGERTPRKKPGAGDERQKQAGQSPRTRARRKEEEKRAEEEARRIEQEQRRRKKKKGKEKMKAEEERVGVPDGEIDWERMMRLEERLEEMQAQATRKGKGKAPVKKKGGNVAMVGEESQFIFSDAFQLSPLPTSDDSDEDGDEAAKAKERGELEAMWRDANLFIDTVSAKIPEEEKPDECEHDFIFKEDIGKVCVECGKVGQLVTNTFDIQRLSKRGALANKRDKSRAFDSDDEPRPPNLDEEDDDEERGELPLLDSHHRNMHEHQKEGFKFVSRNLCGDNPGGCFMHHAPGTGKTYLVISCLQSYFFKFPNRRALISAPKIVLESWQRELLRWQIDPIPTFIVKSEGAANRVEEVRRWFQGTGVLIITPQLLSFIIDSWDGEPEKLELRKMMIEGPNLLVVDEAHYARTARTKVYTSLKHIKTRHRIFLSGTAFQNSLEELFNSLLLCRPNFLSSSPEYLDFASRSSDSNPKWAFFKREVQDKLEVDKGDAVRMFRRLTEPFVQWYDGRVLQSLPGLEDYVLVLNLSEAHMEKLQRFVAVVAKNAMAADRRLNRASIHPCLAEDMFLKEKQNPWEGVKSALVMELLQFVGKKERVIVFCQLKAPLALLKQMLKELFGWSEGQEILHIDGHVNDEERQRLADRFNSSRSRARVLLASLKTCGEGISLIGASRVVILDPAWNPFTIKQAVARAYRYGQTKKVYVYKLLAQGTSEPEKLKNAVDKEFLARSLFDPGFDFLGDHRMVALEDGAHGDPFLDAFEDKPGFADRLAGVFRA